MNRDEGRRSERGQVARLLELPPGRERERLLSELSGEGRAEAQRLLEVADLVWADAHGAPALDDDPAAAVLGLVPDVGYQLDSAALRRARSSAGLKPTALAAALARRGWSVSAGDVFGWETRTAAAVPPALVRAVAEILRIDPDRLTIASASRNRPAVGASQPAVMIAAEVASAPQFRALVERFARVQRMTTKMASSALQARMLATVHRGDQPTAEQMLAAVEALVDALESG